MIRSPLRHESWSAADKFTVVLETAGQVDRWRKAAQVANAQRPEGSPEAQDKWATDWVAAGRGGVIGLWASGGRPESLLATATWISDSQFVYMDAEGSKILAQVHPSDRRMMALMMTPLGLPRISGPGAARQRGLEASRGEFIQFLDSDDLLLPGKFSAQVRAFHQAPHCQICYGPSFEENHADHPLRRRGPMRATGEPRERLFPLLLVERWWTTSSPLYRRGLLMRIGPWQPWINEEDWEYDARAGATGAPLAWVPEPVSVRRIHLAGDHLSDKGCEDPLKLSHRALAQASLFRCARQAGVSLHTPEMRHFARAAFLLSRQCARAGLPTAACFLFGLARQASTPSRRLAPDLLLYGLLAGLLGWQRSTRLSEGMRSWVRGRTS